MKGYTVNKAAERLGLDPSQVRRLLRAKKIKGEKFGRDWMVLDIDYKKTGKGRKPNQNKESKNAINR